MDFSQFCSCGPSGYAYLKQCVDHCSRQGRSYEFSRCRMPSGCQPDRADLGFWEKDGGYLLYLRPTVTYQGKDVRLAGFFSRGNIQSFPNFQALIRCLQGLDDTQSPLSGDLPSLPDLFHQLKESLQSAVLGQEAALEATAFKLYGHLCKRRPSRPLSFLFYGPTCVGKSELGKAITPTLNRLCRSKEYQFIWTELNSFTQAHSVYRLTGAPPGYVGYDDEPVLEAVRHNPYTVFMFDELDKAHPAVLKVFMSILDEGRCAARRKVEHGEWELDFRHCVFVFTTNSDLSSASKPRMGFAPQEEPPERPQTAEAADPASLVRRLFQKDETARQALVNSGVLREIAGRFSGLIGFQDLSAEARVAVTAKQITALGREYGLEIVQVSPAIARSLTPEDALSLRSTVGVLEGILTPLFLAQANRTPEGGSFRLSGTPEGMYLLPVTPLSTPG